MCHRQVVMYNAKWHSRKCVKVACTIWLTKSPTWDDFAKKSYKESFCEHLFWNGWCVSLRMVRNSWNVSCVKPSRWAALQIVFNIEMPFVKKSRRRPRGKVFWRTKWKRCEIYRDIPVVLRFEIHIRYPENGKSISKRQRKTSSTKRAKWGHWEWCVSPRHALRFSNSCKNKEQKDMGKRRRKGRKPSRTEETKWKKEKNLWKALIVRAGLHGIFLFEIFRNIISPRFISWQHVVLYIFCPTESPLEIEAYAIFLRTLKASVASVVLGSRHTSHARNFPVYITRLNNNDINDLQLHVVGSVCRGDRAVIEIWGFGYWRPFPGQYPISKIE